LRDFSLDAALPASAESLTEIHDAIHSGSSLVTAFGTAAKLRNTTGHNLVWDDIFSTPVKYVDLFEQVMSAMSAILYVISWKLI